MIINMRAKYKKKRTKRIERSTVVVLKLEKLSKSGERKKNVACGADVLIQMAQIIIDIRLFIS